MSDDPQAVIRFLSGDHRGTVSHLTGKTYFLLESLQGGLTIESPNGRSETAAIAILHRHGDTYEVVPGVDHSVWINGERLSGHRALRSGDLLELGQSGSVVRFRLYPPGVVPHQTLAEALSDSVNSARVDGKSGIDSTARFVSTLTRELTTHTSVWFRIWMLVLLSLVTVAIVFLVISNFRFQSEVSRELMRLDNLSRLLERSESNRLSREDIERLRSDMSSSLGTALQRVQELEARSDALGRVIRQVAPSVAVVQGRYGFRNPETGEALRFLPLAEGVVFFTGSEEGRQVQVNFAGTAFVVAEGGVLMTNRHVALPWLGEEKELIPAEKSLEPYVIRMRVFFPEHGSALPVSLLAADDSLDLALLQVAPGNGVFAPLVINPEPPSIGDEILVLGYPLGVSGIVARAGIDATKQIEAEEEIDYWQVMDLLAASGDIKPLSTRGIVSQTSSKYIAYDAETTVGGSGGPVIGLDGRVVAINTSIMKGFGGSNLGIPAGSAMALMSRHQDP